MAIERIGPNHLLLAPVASPPLREEIFHLRRRVGWNHVDPISGMTTRVSLLSHAQNDHSQPKLDLLASNQNGELQVRLQDTTAYILGLLVYYGGIASYAQLSQDSHITLPALQKRIAELRNMLRTLDTKSNFIITQPNHNDLVRLGYLD